eukprot:gene15938-17539_t
MRHLVGEMHLIVLALILATKTCNLTVASSQASTSCNPTILRLYGWCEQWTCNNTCKCIALKDCRQYCDVETCRDMRCLSPSTCKQKVHVIGGRTEPRVLNMFARAPFVTQDCSSGKCDVMRAKGPWKRSRSSNGRSKEIPDKTIKEREIESTKQRTNSPSVALQNCISGVCERIVSTLEVSKQFCTFCTKMHCTGKYATNCTQVCAEGNCKQMKCDGKDCQQACLQNATCTMKCSEGVEKCLQICEKGSRCKMHCDAKNCRQICGGGENCEKYANGKRIDNSQQLKNKNVSKSDSQTWTQEFNQSSTVLSTMNTKPATKYLTSELPKTFPTSQLLNEIYTTETTLKTSRNDLLNQENIKDNASFKLSHSFYMVFIIIASTMLAIF